MDQKLFRQKSIDRVSSPEQLNEYIRVASPSVWMVLGAIVILLVGVCVWGVLGRLDTTRSALTVGGYGENTVYIRETDMEYIDVGMTLRVTQMEYTLTEIADYPIRAGEILDEFELHVGGLEQNDWVFAAQADSTLPTGVYPAEIVIESIAPMSFVVN